MLASLVIRRRSSGGSRTWRLRRAGWRATREIPARVWRLGPRGHGDGREDLDMALEMRDRCERCHTPLPHEGEAYICSYECTFCASCATTLGATCSNCGGELVPRPRRRAR